MSDPVTLIFADELRITRSPYEVNVGISRPTGVIIGSIKVNDIPERRRVTLINHRDLQPVAITYSDPVTGAYSFSGLSLNYKYLVICDDNQQIYNAAVADWVTAT